MFWSYSHVDIRSYEEVGISPYKKRFYTKEGMRQKGEGNRNDRGDFPDHRLW
jgi:hypothetical protein